MSYQSTHNERDHETGYDFRNARTSAADVVRFGSVDPLEVASPGFSPYAYVGGNPIRLIDPNGAYAIYVDGMKVTNSSESRFWDRQIVGYANEKINDYNEQAQKANDEAKAANTCSDCPDWVRAVMNPDFQDSEGSSLAYAIPLMPAVAADGPLPIADVVVAAAVATAAIADILSRTYLTYELHYTDASSYFGRTSGFGTAVKIFFNRFSGHHMRRTGVTYSIDKAAYGPEGYRAIRGREQQLIDAAGGIGHPMVANRVRAISAYNPQGRAYWLLSNIYFGNIAPYTGR